MFEEVNTGNNLPVQFDIWPPPARKHADEFTLLFVAKGGGSANKSFLFQETRAVLITGASAGLSRDEDPDARHRGLPALSPGHRHRRHLGRVTSRR